MNSVFERIRYSSNLPARVEIKQGKIAEVYHWHKEIELIYVLDGEVTVTVNNTEQVLCADEFVLINSVENHSLSAENAKCLMVDISYEFAEQFDSSLYNSVFRIPTCGSIRSLPKFCACCLCSVGTKTRMLSRRAKKSNPVMPN